MLGKSSYDYIVIGSGSAGAIVAARLSEDISVSVLLIEAGGSDKNIFIKMPTALGIPMNTRKFNWGFKSEPERFLNDRVMNCPRGRVLGGSSSINGMVYVRGNPFDFDQWETLGANGWNFKNCLPYFKKVENHKIKSSIYTGNDGAVSISGGNNMKNPLYNAFIDSAIEAGYKKTEDYNGYQQEGFGQKFMNVDSGVRASTSHSYLNPIKQRKNLTILSKSLVKKIIFNNKKACGVELTRSNKNYSIYSNKEIILSAGSIGSPHILQISGVGCRKKLKNAGIQVIHDLPGVGENLQDHLEFNFQYQCKQPITLNGQINLLKKLKIGIEWIITKKGLGASNHFEACGFIRSKAGVKWPDIQYHFLPGAITYDGTVAFSDHGFQVHVGHNKPTSRGSITAISSDIKVHPKIHFNYLSTESDRAGFRASVRLTREIMLQKSMKPFVGRAIQPSEHIQTDDEIDEFIRNSVDSAYHPCGTCRMGEGGNAVVDENLSVFGIDGLRVIDSSVFPSIPNGNLNAPTMMLAERATDIIKNKVLKPDAKPKVYLNKKWQTSQR